jgi:hypothetical protein
MNTTDSTSYNSSSNTSLNKKSTNYFLIGAGILIFLLIISAIIYFSVMAVKCNDKCNNNGDCSLLTGKCTCKKGYIGDRCETLDDGDEPKDDPDDETKDDPDDETKDDTKDKTDESENKCSDKCNYNGTCNQETGECKCIFGYSGLRCESTCEEGKFGDNCEYTCYNGGKYNTITKKCECATNYFGDYCTVACLNGGTYNKSNRNCDCINGYFGKDCRESCRNEGKYNTTTKKCDCQAGYSGSTCAENKCSVHNYCNKSGTCDVITGKCTCDNNFSGEFCDKFTPIEEVYVIIKEGGFGVTDNCRETSDMKNTCNKYNARYPKFWELTKAYEDGSQVLLPSYYPSTNPATIGELSYSLIMQRDNCANLNYVQQSSNAIKNTGVNFDIKKGFVFSESLTWSSNRIKFVNIDKGNIVGLFLYGIKPNKNEMNVWENLNEPPPFKNGFCILNWYTSCDGKTPNKYSQN